jgi:hypothetical protein
MTFAANRGRIGRLQAIPSHAIMRKLVVLANALLSKNRMWTQKPD